MSSFTRWTLAAALVASVCGGGCRKAVIPTPRLEPPKDYYRELPPGAPALRKITDPARIPDFRAAFHTDRASLLASLDHSIRYLGYPSSRKYYPLLNVPEVTHERAISSLKAFRALLDAVSTPEEFQQRILSGFDVYESVGCDDRGTVQFTGYYTPIFDASLTPTAEFKWPLYSRPPDLERNGEGTTLGRRTRDGHLVPFFTRAEINAGAIKGCELAYLKDPFEAYTCTVQGSAQLRLSDGRLFKIGYAGNNGYDYVSVGMALVKDGEIPRSELSLAGLTAYFKAHPEKRDEYLAKNPRYVFFQPTELPPVGSLNLPVTPYRSIATDKGIFPRGCLAYVDTLIPQADAAAVTQAPFKQFVLDQDAGGAIRAPGRCDIYLGIGPEAGRIAGWTMNEGALYYLFVKE